MKKIISLILVVVMAISFTLVLASCSDEPELNFLAAKSNLDDAGYVAILYENEDVLRGMGYVGAVKALVATKSGESIYMAEFEDSATAKLYVEKYELERDNEIEINELMIEYNEYILDEYGSQLTSDDIDEIKDGIKDLKKKNLELADQIIGCSGKIAWSGTSAAVEASRGI